MGTVAVIERLSAERDEAVDFIEHVMGQVDAESRDVSETEQRTLDSHRERIAQIDAQVKPLVEFQQQRASGVKADRMVSGTDRVQRAASAPPDGLSLGSAFISSDQFRSFGGGISGRYTFDAAPSEVRAVLTTTTPPGSAWMPTPPKYVTPSAAYTTPLLDVIQRVPVTSGSIDVVTYGLAAEGAAVVAEGADKPEATLETTVTPTVLDTIAAWVQTSRQLMADAPSARNIIDNQLTRGVLRKLEELITAAISGNAGIQTSTGAADVPLVGVIRQAMAVLQSNGFNPDVVMANPGDLAGIDVSIMTGTLNGPSLNGAYWGLRPVPVPGFAAGTVIVADAAAAFTLFERTGVEVYMTDSDVVGATGKSAFRANILTVLAETRAKGVVVNPLAAQKAVATVTPPVAATASAGGRK